MTVYIVTYIYTIRIYTHDLLHTLGLVCLSTYMNINNDSFLYSLKGDGERGERERERALNRIEKAM